MPIVADDLQRKIDAFSFSAEEERRLQALHDSFLQKFPRDSIRTLSLQDYALGLREQGTSLEQQTLSYWMEFGTKELGIIAGTAYKHIVYYDTDARTYRFKKEYRNENEAFEAVRQCLLTLFERVDSQQFRALAEIPPLPPGVKGKYLYMYFRDSFVPIFSEDHLQALCAIFGLAVTEDTTAPEMNRLLFGYKESHNVFGGWSSLRFMYFLYDQFRPAERFWKIAPGEQAVYWPEFRDQGCICVGWDDVGDVSRFPSGKAYREEFAKHYQEKPAQLYGFAHIAEGDHIVANKGMKEVVGIGVVTSPYEFDDTRSYFKHKLTVRWLHTAPFEKPDNVGGNWAQTVSKLNREGFEAILAAANVGKSKLRWKRSATGYDLQLLNPELLQPVELEQRFNAFQESTLGHSGGAYLDKEFKSQFPAWIHAPSSPFTEFFLAIVSNWYSTELSSVPRQSPRRAAAEALWNALFLCLPEDRLTNPGKNNVVPERFEAWWQRQMFLQGEVPSELPADGGLVVSTKLGEFSALPAETFVEPEFFIDCRALLERGRQVILQGAPGMGKTYIAEKIAMAWAGDERRVKTVQFHESYGYEDFVEGIKPAFDGEKAYFKPQHGTFLRFCNDASTHKFGAGRYVLIIDEINRAKTARVFGELLYLLEYRNKNIWLQDGQEFRIPGNVYVIGTMNTVDRSIALVDYALRRRFAFMTLQPERGDGKTILGEWLRAHAVANAAEIEELYVELNRRVRDKIGEGLVVGHSYFMKQPDEQSAPQGQRLFSNKMLRRVWQYEILPLISEYEHRLKPSQIQEQYGLEAIRDATSPDDSDV